MLTYFGDCMTGLRSPLFRSKIAEDADSLCVIVYAENPDVTYLSAEEFGKKVDVLDAHKHYLTLDPDEDEIELGYNPAAEIAWIYDHSKDVHYFYA